MHFSFYDAIIPAIVIGIVVLVLEEWAFFKAKSRLQRALITGVTVFVILLLVNLLLPSTGF